MDATTISIRACSTGDGRLLLEGVDRPDDELVQAARSGASWALVLLTSRYRERIHAYARGMLRHAEDAEDVTQETFVRAYSELASYGLRDGFRAWLFRIATNLCRDLRRRRHARCVSVPGHQLEAVAGGDDPVEGITLRTVVQSAVGRLPEKYRAPVLLHYMEGLTVAETAAALGRTRTAVCVQLWRARHQLAVELADLHREQM
jgi:RNA polymerase sigma-70 factor (ECF subfamily)